VAHQIVAIERDVERAGRHVHAGDGPEMRGETRRNRHPARADADERQLVGAAVALEDLVRDSREAAADSFRVHYDRHCRLRSDDGVQADVMLTSLRPLGTALKSELIIPYPGRTTGTTGAGYFSCVAM
jgi:hypothetical protein